MKNLIYLIALSLFSTTMLCAQTTIWTEDFETDAINDGCEVGCTVPASSKWAVSSGGCAFSSDDYLKVTSFGGGQVMEAKDLDGQAVWTSEGINISGYTNVTIDAAWREAYCGSTDYLRFYYIIDGGSETYFTTNGNVTGSTIGGDNNNGASSVGGLSGSLLTIVVRTMNSSTSDQWRFDNFVVQGDPPACTAPTPVPTSPVFSSITTTSMNVAWTNGGGTETLVVVKESGVTLAEPVSTNAYTANTVYSSGTNLGSSNYVVYNSTGSSVTVTGLSPGTTYDYAIYTLNSADNCYNLDELDASENTICTPPVTQATSLLFSSVAKTSMDISWTNGSGTAVLVVAKLAASTHADPAIGITYTANTSFGSGDQIGSGNYVIYNGVGTSVTMIGLTADTDYDISIYSYFSASDCYNLTELAGSQTTLAGTNHVLAGGTYEIDVYDGDTITTCGGTFTDSNPSTTGNYGNNEDYTVTFCSGSGSPMSFDFNNSGFFDALATGDTLYMYDEVGDLIMQIDGTDDPSFSQFELSTVSQCVTFRFVSNGSTNDDGWAAVVECIAAPASCNGNEPAADIALQAPYICNLDGYCGSTSNYYHEDLPDDMVSGGNCPSAQAFLGTIENNSWLRFLAGATSVSMDFTVSGCGSDGIQVAILGDDGSGWTRYSGCAQTDGANTGTFTLAATGLTIGETYFIMADGNAGANCDYTIAVDASSGILTVDAGADQTVCVGDPVNLTVSGPAGATYTWNSLDGVITNATGASQTFNPLVATTYVVEVSGDGICASKTDTVVVDMCVILPVELLGFSAECKDNYVELNWQTASEINNDYFEVEKSTDGINFLSIGYVSGAGNSNSVSTYSLQDFEQGTDLVYYQLKQVDFNGETSYSELVALDKCDDAIYEISNVYYNSSKEIIIDYTVSKSEHIQVNLFDVQGKVVQQNEVTIYQNEDQLRIPLLNNLDNAVYLVRIVSAVSVDTKKIIISK